jgi:sulfonate transport system ATP-binding protein
MLLVTHDLDEALYLSDRVVVMSGRPAALIDAISIALPGPRDRRAPELAAQRAHLLKALHLTGVQASEATMPGPRGDHRPGLRSSV